MNINFNSPQKVRRFTGICLAIQLAALLVMVFCWKILLLWPAVLLLQFFICMVVLDRASEYGLKGVKRWLRLIALIIFLCAVCTAGDLIINHTLSSSYDAFDARLVLRGFINLVLYMMPVYWKFRSIPHASSENEPSA